MDEKNLMFSADSTDLSFNSVCCVSSLQKTRLEMLLEETSDLLALFGDTQAYRSWIINIKRQVKCTDVAYLLRRVLDTNNYTTDSRGIDG